MTNAQKQCLLCYLGYYTGLIDGQWGTQSRQATERFQQEYGLEADGIFGPATEEAIRKLISGDTADWWKNILYFRREEFRCGCGGKYCDGFPAEPKRQLVELADQVREHFGSAADVSSGVRCQQHNDSLSGSVPNSRHISGKAVDFRIRGKTAMQVLDYVCTLSGVRYAYAIDGSFVHMDIA